MHPRTAVHAEIALPIIGSSEIWNFYRDLARTRAPADSIRVLPTLAKTNGTFMVIRFDRFERVRLDFDKNFLNLHFRISDLLVRFGIFINSWRSVCSFTCLEKDCEA